MFYSDLSFRACQTRVSIHIVRFVSHYAEYRNNTLVRFIPLSAITWC